MEYALGVMAAALLGVSFVLQQGAAERVPSGDFLRLRLVGDLLRQPRWLAGFGTMICGQLLSAWVIGHIILAATFAVRAPMYWSNGFGGLAVLVFALAGLASLRRPATAGR